MRAAELAPVRLVGRVHTGAALSTAHREIGNHVEHLAVTGACVVPC